MLCIYSLTIYLLSQATRMPRRWQFWGTMKRWRDSARKPWRPAQQSRHMTTIHLPSRMRSCSAKQRKRRNAETTCGTNREPTCDAHYSTFLFADCVMYSERHVTFYLSNKPLERLHLRKFHWAVFISEMTHRCSIAIIAYGGYHKISWYGSGR